VKVGNKFVIIQRLIGSSDGHAETYLAAHNPGKRGFHNFFVLKKYRKSEGQRLACGLASFRRELNAFKRLDIDMNIGSEFIVKADGVVANKDAYFFGLVCIYTPCLAYLSLTVRISAIDALQSGARLNARP
jgi:hypothetical protein